MNFNNSGDNVNATEDTGIGMILFHGLNGYPVTITYFLISIVTALIGIWIIILNALVIQILTKNRNSLYTADIFVISLAVADFFTGIILLYNMLYSLLNYQDATECRFRFGLLILVSVSSGWHLCALAIDRFIKISRPLHYTNIFKQQTVIIICVFVWIFSFIVGLLPMGWKKDLDITDTEDNLLCSFFGSLSDGYMILIVILFWIPVGFMFVLYMFIFKIAKRHASAIAVQENIGNKSQNKFFEKGSWKFTKTISIIIGIYLIMWMPTGLLIMIYLEGHLVDKTKTELGELLLFVSAPAFLNSLLNPIIYAFKIKTVKEKYRKIFCQCSSMTKTTKVLQVTQIGRSNVTQMTRTTKFENDQTSEW